VKHAVRASVERYSIKDLEPFYAFKRALDLVEVRTNLRVVERALELGAVDAITPEVRSAVESYNRDDCLSALQLRGWLEELRTSVVASGTSVPRPRTKEGGASEQLDEQARRVQAAVAALTAGVSAERAQRSEEQQAKWLLAHLLDWHRREEKAPWWEFFRLRDLSDEELFDEKAAISGLRFVERVGGTSKSPIDRYNYPLQDNDVRVRDSLHLTDGIPFGKVDVIDRVARTIDVKKPGAQADMHPTSVFAHSVVPSKELANALMRIAEDVIQHGIVGGTDFRVARELLLARPPRIRSGAFEPRPEEDAVAFATRIATDLDNTVLAIQGPPGAGKTSTALPAPSQPD
jgi:uncharacterized protein